MPANTVKDAVPGATVHGVATDLGRAQGCQALVSAEPDADILIKQCPHLWSAGFI
jgi:hypothetical protein